MRLFNIRERFLALVLCQVAHGGLGGLVLRRTRGLVGDRGRMRILVLSERQLVRAGHAQMGPFFGLFADNRFDEFRPVHIVAADARKRLRRKIVQILFGRNRVPLSEFVRFLRRHHRLGKRRVLFLPGHVKRRHIVGAGPLFRAMRLRKYVVDVEQFRFALHLLRGLRRLGGRRGKLTDVDQVTEPRLRLGRRLYAGSGFVGHAARGPPHARLERRHRPGALPRNHDIAHAMELIEALAKQRIDGLVGFDPAIVHADKQRLEFVTQVADRRDARHARAALERVQLALQLRQVFRPATGAPRAE